jgi:peptide/nickel transport system substrate-binding protein
MNHLSTDLVSIARDQNQSLSNTEWQLADMVDAIAAEIDHAEDTLALKSYARGMSFSIRQLSLDLQVAVRRDDNGQIKFRTAEPNSTGTTIIKLDFAQLLKSQLGDDRRKLEQNIDRRPLDALGLTTAEIRSLNAISIYSVDDLYRYTQTAAMIGEVSRKTTIGEVRLRQILGLPYLEALKPDRGLPGSIVLLEGGNFGTEQPRSASVYFQGVAVPIVAWSNSRIQIKIPETATGSGVIFIAMNDQISNPIDWQVVTVDLMIKDIMMTPSNPQDNDEITLTATLENQGLGVASAFAVQWSIDGQRQAPQAHGTLLPNQMSQESSVIFKTRLAAGKHAITCTADPEQQLKDLDRANSTFTVAIDVAPRTEIINLGYHYLIDSLDPFIGEQSWDLRQDVLSLIYRGLMRFDPYKGRLLTDLSQRTNLGMTDSLTVTYSLRQDVYFQDNSLLTAGDVVFSYKRAKESSIWRDRLRFIEAIEVLDRFTVMFKFSDQLNINADPQIWTLPIVPAKAYQADSKRFITHPIGCGAFIGSLEVGALEGEKKSGLVQLEAFDNYYLGAPRSKTLSIALSPDANRLLKLLIGGYVMAITLPDQEGLAEKLKPSLQGKYQIIRTTIGQSKVLQIQNRSLLERTPNNYETNWNAHLWYL